MYINILFLYSLFHKGSRGAHAFIVPIVATQFLESSRMIDCSLGDVKASKTSLICNPESLPSTCWLGKL
jgi:hypothetical protein